MTSQPTLFDIETDAERAFRIYHESNPRVYDLFKRFAFEAIEAGRSRFGAWMIWNRMRWYTTIETHDASFKLNNNYIAHYARQFMKDYPEHAGLFETRNMKDDR